METPRTHRPNRPPTIADLDDLPEEMVGEIIDGELIVHPRPDPPHARASYRLGLTLGRSFEEGLGDPGGWIIIAEPRVRFDAQTLVPDLAGWRKERYEAPRKGPFQVPPDWVCEILSPSTARDDRARKLPIYARSGVHHAWLLDPLQRSLEMFRRQDDAWLLIVTHVEGEKVRAEPFEAVEIDLALIWGETVAAEGDEAAD